MYTVVSMGLEHVPSTSTVPPCITSTAKTIFYPTRVAASQAGPKIVLDHVRVLCIKEKSYVCALWVSSPLVVYDAIDNAFSSRAQED